MKEYGLEKKDRLSEAGETQFCKVAFHHELEDVLGSAGMGIWAIEMVDGEHPRFYIDDTARNIMGITQALSPEEVYDFWERNVMPSELDSVKASVNEMISNGKSENTYAWIHPVKGKIYVRCGGTLDKSYTKGIRIRGYHQDVTKIQSIKEEKERELKNNIENQSIMAALCEEYISVYYVNLDKDSYEIKKRGGFANQGEIFRLKTYTEVIKAYVDNFVREDEREDFMENLSVHKLSEFFKNHDDFIFRYRASENPGGQSNFEIHAVRVGKGENSTSHTIILAFRCIDAIVKRENIQREKLKSALDQAKKANAAKSSFLSRMSHDIRTPINGILGLIEMSDRNPDNMEKQQEYRDKERVVANHLLSLVNDVLDVSKLEDDKIELAHEPIDMRKLVNEIYTLSSIRASEEGILIYADEINNALEYPYVFGSEVHIKQIFVNILSNAIKYNKPGGSISTSTVVVSKDNDHVVYRTTIKDTGIGMSPQYIKHIFEPFSQEHSNARSHYQGTGLGMAIVKSLVDKMKGTITVESTPGKGSTFVVTLPYDINHDPAAGDQKENKNCDISGMKVLLVEDNELNMEIATFILEDNGVLVTKAHDGKEAVDIYNNNMAGAFDAILMDIMMPVMDGYTATKKIRKLQKPDSVSIPIIAMTANAFMDDIKAAKAAGMNEHLSKPVDSKKLSQVLGKYKK